jgi:hypothetical protein
MNLQVAGAQRSRQLNKLALGAAGLETIDQ